MSFGEFWRRLCFVLHRDRLNAELEEEMRLHRELRARRLEEQGAATAGEARFQAQRSFGNATLLQEVSRDTWGFRWLADFVQDVRLAGRQFRKTPGFTAIALITLALGIGANTSIFTLINGVLLKALPVRDPAGLVVLGYGRGSGTSIGIQRSFTLYSYDLYRHLEATNLFEGLCAAQSAKATLSVRRAGAGPVMTAEHKLVSGNYFEVLGVKPALGRGILPSDDSPSAPPVAVISYRYWREALNGDPGVLGTTLELARAPVTIIGVAPPGFYGEQLQPDPPSLWLPLSAMRHLAGKLSIIDDPDIHWLYVMGRLRPGISRTQAQTRLTDELRNWLTAREGSNPSPETRAEIARSHIDVTPGGSGINQLQRESAPMLRLLLALAGMVLLITCANVSNLLLARGAARTAENSVRLALGAGRGRLVRQSLTESTVLALGGGALGLFVAAWATRLLVALAFPGIDYIPIRTTPDARVLVFAFVLSFAAAITFGALPALRTTSGIALAIRGGSGGIKGSRLSLGKSLIIGEVAVSVVVLAMAGLFARSLANLTGQQFGFDREHVLVADVDPVLAGYTFERLGPFYRQLYSRLNSLPGVRSASLSSYSPLHHCCWGFTIVPEGIPPKHDQDDGALLDRVSAGYFETLGTKILLGRTFDERDTASSRFVALVTESFARRYWPNENPIGRRFAIGSGGDPLEIVGMVADAQYRDPRERAPAMAFLPLLQVKPSQSANETGEYGSNFIGTIEVRAAGDPAAIAGEIRRALAEVDPNLPVLRMATLSEHIGRAVTQENLIADLSVAFGLLALVLACVGLYGLMSYAVARRTGELGLRIALGAQRGTVIRMVLGEVALQGAAGILIGVPAAFAAVRLVAAQLYGVSPSDPRFAAAAAIALFLSMTWAGYVPARRAARIDPLQALRQE